MFFIQIEKIGLNKEYLLRLIYKLLINKTILDNWRIRRDSNPQPFGSKPNTLSS